MYFFRYLPVLRKKGWKSLPNNILKMSMSYIVKCCRGLTTGYKPKEAPKSKLDELRKQKIEKRNKELGIEEEVKVSQKGLNELPIWVDLDKDILLTLSLGISLPWKEELEEELKEKQRLLADREKRVNELEEMMQRKDEAVRILKNKVSDALLGYKNRGLTVQERNGKIYVSLDAKLLFKTGSTLVEPEGRKAILDLTKVLENEKELEIIVEGHTDSDKMSSSIHPKNNWELSVLRATSVVDIMTSNMQVNPTILMAAGRSEFHPIDLKLLCPETPCMWMQSLIALH
jgi:flagellar motor protein MotB